MHDVPQSSGAYTGAVNNRAAPIGGRPLGLALSQAIDNLFRCENFSGSIRERLHGASPKGLSTSEQSTPPWSIGQANMLADRLENLANALEEINNSF